MSEGTMTVNSLCALVKETHGVVVTTAEFDALREQGAPITVDGTFHAGHLAAWLTARELGTL